MARDVPASYHSLPVLTYHRIGKFTHNVEPTLTISPEEFENQLGWLKRNNYNTITAEFLNQVIQGREAMPPRPVLLTFDDAYEELCEYAFPRLLANGFTATVFVVTGRVGQTNIWDQANGYSSLQLMSAEQIRHWAERGIDFGSHSRTHPVLTDVMEADLFSEVGNSAEELGSILGRKIACFAYPHGRHNKTVRAVTAKCYDLAFCTEEGLNDAGTDRSRIRRTMVRPKDSLHMFSHRVSNGTSPFYDLRQWRAEARLRSRLRDMFRVFHQA